MSSPARYSRSPRRESRSPVRGSPSNQSRFSPRGNSPRGGRSRSPVRGNSPRGGSPNRNFRGNSRDRDHDRSNGKPPRIFIGNLPTGPDKPSQRDLENLFEKYGKVTRVDVKDGYGFVEFDDEDAMQEACARENGSIFHRHKIRVQLSFAAQGVGPSRSRGVTPGTGECFNCGVNGHWSKECPQKHRRGGGGGDYNRGRDDNRGGRDDRGRDDNRGGRDDRGRDDNRGGRDDRGRDDNRGGRVERDDRGRDDFRGNRDNNRTRGDDEPRRDNRRDDYNRTDTRRTDNRRDSYDSDRPRDDRPRDDRPRDDRPRDDRPRTDDTRRRDDSFDRRRDNYNSPTQNSSNYSYNQSRDEGAGPVRSRDSRPRDSRHTVHPYKRNSPANYHSPRSGSPIGNGMDDDFNRKDN